MKKCYKIPKHTRSGRPVASHIRCRDFKNKYDKYFFKQTKQLLYHIESDDDIDYDVSTNQSKTDFGKSEYIYLYPKGQSAYDSGEPLKIRISDHDVSNLDRITNEIHFKDTNKITKKDVEFIKDSANFRYKRNTFFEKKDYFVKKTSYKVQTREIKLGDIITKEFKTKKGEIMYEVTRDYDIKETGWFNKKTGRLF